LSFSGEAERKLSRHDWPGNARELANIVQRAAWLACGGVIQASDLDTGPAAGAADSVRSAVNSPPVEELAAPPPREVGLDHDLKQHECELILTTLRVTGGSRKLTAERLGISPRTLRHKLQHLKAAGVSVPDGHDQQAMAV
jgi:two-component system response regulator FlrC